jgi:hypothetical protein
MTLPYGRGSHGERMAGPLPVAPGDAVNPVAVLAVSGLAAPSCYCITLTTCVRLFDLDTFLLPSLRIGQTLSLGNHPDRRSRRVQPSWIALSCVARSLPLTPLDSIKSRHPGRNSNRSSSGSSMPVPTNWETLGHSLQKSYSGGCPRLFPACRRLFSRNSLKLKVLQRWYQHLHRGSRFKSLLNDLDRIGDIRRTLQK